MLILGISLGCTLPESGTLTPTLADNVPTRSTEEPSLTPSLVTPSLEPSSESTGLTATVIPSTASQTATNLPSVTPLPSSTESIEETGIPTPTRIVDLTPTFEATPLGGDCPGFPCYHQADQVYVVNVASLKIRSSIDTRDNTNVIGSRTQGQQFRVQCLVEWTSGMWWGSTEPCFGPGFHKWSAIQFGNNPPFAVPLSGPVGGR